MGSRGIESDGYEDLLREHVDGKATYGEAPQPPSSDDAVQRLRKRVERELGTEMPDGYATFLGLMNGLDSNGLVIYASQTSSVQGRDDALIEGFVEANLGHWDNQASRRFLFFGESGVSFYVQDRQDGTYRILDRQSQSVMEDLPSFEALVARALEENRP